MKVKCLTCGQMSECGDYSFAIRGAPSAVPIVAMIFMLKNNWSITLPADFRPRDFLPGACPTHGMGIIEKNGVAP